MTRRWLLCGALSLMMSPAMGQSIGSMKITVSSVIAPKIPYGNPMTYALEGDPSCGDGGSGSIMDISWKYKYTGPGCVIGWSSLTSTGTNRSIIWFEGYAGNFIVQADVTVRCGYSSTVIPVAGSATVLPPDGIRMPTPAIVTTAFGVTTNFRFQITSGGLNCGYIQGTPLEDLTQRVVLGMNDVDLIKGGNLLFFHGPSIIDPKTVTPQALFPTVYNPLATGATFTKLKQQFFVRMVDVCGVTQTYPLSPPFFVTRTKADNNNYTTTIAP